MDSEFKRGKICLKIAQEQSVYRDNEQLNFVCNNVTQDAVSPSN